LEAAKCVAVRIQLCAQFVLNDLPVQRLGETRKKSMSPQKRRLSLEQKGSVVAREII